MPDLLLRDALMQRLKDPRKARGYLQAALEEDDPDFFLVALRDVAEAQGGVGGVAKKAKLHRTGLYRFFAKGGNPTYRNLRTVLEAMGYRLRLEKTAA